MKTIIEMRDISWVRDGKTLLQDVDWSVEEHQHWAILGLNGSGKTTLLNMLNGYQWPTTGRISVLGQTFGEVDVRELRRSIGWVSSSLQEKLYVNEKAENLVVSGKFASIGLYEQPTDEDYEKARSLMEQLQCAHLYNRTYQTCSQGEKQKLLIARALMASPKLLILDEATNGLDFISREALLSSIEWLSQQPDAPHMIYVTHHTEEILPIFSHTLLLRRGEVFAAGPTREVLQDDHLSAFFEMPVELTWRHDRAWLAKR
ncbi:iron complex transport system ATP-binding protein [Paenibacillus shirakamiensis]|uniref:Iron complex transport system ATP-binding protein n=1 Tax=Paenibacillus shirakamiensis TaxID=1265935 RepID=A0ABS4JGE1_9BACL|nr:ABC transporter ATP-binding protein [Paenibacillus shirakamiensis]MBP1999634.1 iron complex transport system ATP-binding protein [Paenibacillus shirakamiensis]